MRSRGAFLRVLGLGIASLLFGVTAAYAPECPCISPNSPLIAQANEQFAALGAPGYGAAGECRAYDKELEFAGCVGALESDCPGGPLCFCFEEWCYVDPSTCEINKAKCIEAGGTVGTDVSPYCRDREFQLSSLIADKTGNTTALAYYSYATCGSLNTYDTSRLSEVIAGRNLKIKITESYYWTYKEEEADPRAQHWLGWTGVLNKALDDGFLRFSPAVNVTLDESWSSALSRTKFASSWTACVLDVAVGNADMCIGDFWVTPQRMNLANFLTPFDNDNFYLVAPRTGGDEPLFDILQKPFLPFSNMLWVITFWFLVFSALVMMVTDGHNMDDYDNQGKFAILFKSLYFAFAGYVQGGSANMPASVPGRLATLGFGFFVLITLASYTANLATILVSKGSVTGITGPQDAIDKGVTICIPIVVEAQLRSNFPSAKFFLITNTGDVARSLFNGKCGAAILQETAINSMLAGKYAQADCKLLDEGDLTEEEAHCVRDDQGNAKLDRDCWLVKTGELIMSVPLSVPVRTDLVQGLGWALRKTLQDGKVDQLKASFESTLPPPACGEDGSLTEAADNPLESLRLPANAMLGTTILSVLVMLLALALSGVEIYTGRTIQQILGCGKESDGDFAPATVSGGTRKGRSKRKALLPSGSKKNLMDGMGGGGDPRALKLQNKKLDDMHRMLAKLCGEDVSTLQDIASPRTGTKVVPLGAPAFDVSLKEAWSDPVEKL